MTGRLLAVVALDLQRRLRDHSLLAFIVIAPLALVIFVSPIADSLGPAVGATRPLVAVHGDDQAFEAASAVARALNVDVERSRELPSEAGEAVAVLDLDATPVRLVLTSSDPDDALVARELARLVAGTPAVDGLLDHADDSGSATTRTCYSVAFAHLVVVLLLAVGARQLAAEVRGDMARRMRSIGLGPWAFAGGKVVASSLTGAVAIVVAWALAAVVADVSWGPASVVLLVSASLAIATAALALLCAVLLPTPRQSQSVAMLVGTLMILAGGTLVPVWEQPGWLRALARVVPTGIALRAQLHEVLGIGAPFAAILPLLAIGIVAFVFSGRTLARGLA